jgi:hypothetical protein
MSPRHGHRTSAQRIKTAERRLFALELRRGGASYPAIARAVIARFPAEDVPKGYDKAYAYKDVRRELDRIREAITDKSGEYLALEVVRVDEAIRRLWILAWPDEEWAEGSRGEVELAAVDRLLRAMERKAKLLGLDGPSKLAFTDTTGRDAPELTDAERARALAAYAGRISAEADRRNDSGPDQSE